MTLIDTDILIDTARGIEKAITCLRTLEEHAELTISSITQMEMIVGCENNSELKALEKFLERFVILPVSEEVSLLAVHILKTYRLSHGLKIADALIASTAIAHNIPLISKNQRDYRFIKTLTLLPYS